MRENDGGWTINLAVASDLLPSAKVTDNRLSFEIDLSEFELDFPN